MNKKLNSDIDCKYRGVVVRLRGFSLIFIDHDSLFHRFRAHFFTDLGLTFKIKGKEHFQKIRPSFFDNATFLRSRWDFIDRNFVFRVHFLIKDHNPTFIDLTFYHFL